MSLLIGGGTVVLLLVLMIAGPALGLAPALDVQERQLQEPLGDTTSAQLDLGLSVGRATVSALTDSADLLNADLRYVGGVDYHGSGTQGKKLISLSSRDEGFQFFDLLSFSFVGKEDADQLRWNIGLTTAIPLDLRLNGGVGDATIDLTGIQLSHLSYNNGVGDATITLPAAGDYPFALNGGVGNVTINFAAGTSITADVNGGVGNMILDVPDNAAVVLTKNGGLGTVHTPSDFQRVNGDANRIDSAGVWHSAGYTSASADNLITINYEVASAT